MLFFARRRRIGLLAPILFGVGGAALGATLALFLTPTTGHDARDFVRNLLKRETGDDNIDAALESMENEGGLMGSSPSRATHS